MFRNLLLKFANKIINKYGIHMLENNSIVQIWDTKFKIISYSITKTLYSDTTLQLEGIDILQNIDLTNTQ